MQEHDFYLGQHGPPTQVFTLGEVDFFQGLCGCVQTVLDWYLLTLLLAGLRVLSPSLILLVREVWGPNIISA